MVSESIPRPSTGSDAGDLVKRLETEAEILRDWREPGHSVLRATAEEIDCAIAMIAALSEENERLKAALEPFGKVTVLYREGVAWSLDDPDLDDLSIGELYIRAVDLRRAAKLGQMKGEG